MQGRRKIQDVCGEQGAGDRREVEGEAARPGALVRLRGGAAGRNSATAVHKGSLHLSLTDSFTCNILNAINHPVREETEAGSSSTRSRRSQY